MKKIVVENINFSYDQEQEVVKNVSFDVEEGSYTTIIGHNGSGKSTIAKLLMGLLPLDSGSIKIDDLPLNEDSINTMRKKVGIVFQNPDNQFIGSSVEDDIAFGLENHNIKQAKMRAIIDKFAKRVGMIDYLDKEPTNLSGGQKQRVAIAGVLAMSPSILIFDEATSMLDPSGKQEIKQLIHDIHKLEKISVVSITHDMEEVASSDHVIVMDQGSVVMDGDPSDILLHKEKLQSINLDIPFALHISNAINERGISIPNCITIERLVNAICQLNLVK